MSQTYAAGRAAARANMANMANMAAGGVILIAISFLAAVLVIAGLAYAAGTGGRHKAALAAAQCEPNLSPSGLPCTTVPALTGQYLAITTPATQQLSIDAAAYTASQKRHLTAAESALTAAMAAEHALSARLASFPFPPAVAPAAKVLIHASQALATLFSQQARSSSLTQLSSLNPRVDAASAAVQADIRLVRHALATPPTANQEP
jgi:hypothetical protein